jgi:AraC-like DNA-binding protein
MMDAMSIQILGRISMSEAVFSVFPNKNFIDIELYQYGWEHCSPAHAFGPAARSHYLFHYVISGAGTLIAENDNRESVYYSIKSGQGFLIFPDQICTYIADHDVPWEYAWLEFDGLRAKEVISLTGLSKEAPVYHARYTDIADTMKSEMLYITGHKDASPFHLIGHLYLFLDCLIRSSASTPMFQTNSLHGDYIREAISYMEQNFQNDITIEDIAAYCGLNRSYFGKIFRENVGKSPQEFLIAYRMSRATELLKLTRLSIADIGQAVGYPNQLHFSRAFKRVYGVSPKQWREAN